MTHAITSELKRRTAHIHGDMSRTDGVGACVQADALKYNFRYETNCGKL